MTRAGLAGLVFVAACSSSGRATPSSVTDRRIATVTTADTGRPTATTTVDVRAVGLRNRDGWCSTMHELTARKALQSDWWKVDDSCVPGVPPTAGVAR